MPHKHTHHMASQKLALVKALVLLLCLSGGIVALIWWAKDNEDSKFAQQVRHFVGVEGPKQPAPVVVVAPPPPPPVVEAPVMVEPTPEPEPDPEPEPEALSFEDYLNNFRLWPKTLKLTLKTRVPIIFNEKDYGYMEFVPGQIIEVESLTAPDQILGLVNGKYLSIAVDQTNLAQWFAEKYAETYTLTLPKISATQPSAAKELSHYELNSEVLYWCYHNYGKCSFKVEEDAIILKWLPKEDAPIDFRMEARTIAAHYLKKQMEMGGSSNYTSCEIRDPRSNDLLGEGSVFIPGTPQQPAE